MTELTTNPPGPADRPPLGIRLTGWKEIATYLDKAVRTVQRWERDFELPVRRASGDRVSSVYAYTSDLDEWLRSPAGTRAGRQELADASERQDDSTPNRDAAEAPDDESRNAGARVAPGGRRASWLTWVLVAAVLVLAGGLVWHTWGPAPVPKPASFRVEGDTLTVVDARGTEVFRHRFPARLARQNPLLPESTRGGVEDLDGDDLVETWFIATPADFATEFTSGLFVFNEDGSIRWQYRYSGSVRFDKVTFGAPWTVGLAYTTPPGDGNGGRAIWVASYDRTEFPSVLQRLDGRTGEATATYWSNGYISSLALSTWHGRPALLVGGAFNEGRASSLAVLDVANPNGSAPATQAKYRCSSCPPGLPLAFVVFPRPHRFSPIDECGTLYLIDARGADSIVLRVLQSDAGTINATVIYRLDGELRPLAADPADGYQATYDAKVRAGLIPPYVPRAVNPAREFLPILHWVDGRFVPVGKVTK